MSRILGPLSDVEIAFLIHLAGNAPDFLFRAMGVNPAHEEEVAAVGAVLATLRATGDESGGTTASFDEASESFKRAVVDSVAVYSLRTEVSTLAVTSMILDAGASTVEVLVGEKRMAGVHDLDGESDAAALLLRRIREVPAGEPVVVRRDAPEGTRWYGMFGDKAMTKLRNDDEMTQLGALDPQEFAALILSGGEALTQPVGVV